MTIAEIFEQLRTRFSGRCLELDAPAAGDAVIAVSADALRDVCRTLRDDPVFRFDFLRLVSGVDRAANISSIYHLYSYPLGHSVTLRVDTDRRNPLVPTVSDLWPAANWLERECYDMFGIEYQGHPELTRLLLPQDWEGFPLRKDYQQPAEYHGIKHD